MENLFTLAKNCGFCLFPGATGLKGNPVEIRNCSRNCKLSPARNGGMPVISSIPLPVMCQAHRAGRLLAGRKSGDLPHSHKQS